MHGGAAALRRLFALLAVTWGRAAVQQPVKAGLHPLMCNRNWDLRDVKALRGRSRVTSGSNTLTPSA